MYGILADYEQRKKFITGDKKDWKSFLRDENIIQDKLNVCCATIIENFKLSLKIILVTGRNEFTRAITHEWVAQNDLRFDMLLMRKNNDYRQDANVKEEIYRQNIMCFFV